MIDVALLTEERYLHKNKNANWYVENIFLEDRILEKEFKKLNISSARVAWDHCCDLKKFKHVLFRTPWNYFEQINQFLLFLNRWKNKINFINKYDQIIWNLNKKYLLELESLGVNIPKTTIVKRGSSITLREVFREGGWQKAIVKPCVSAAAWETHLVERVNALDFENQFRSLVVKQDMMVQSFQKNILSFGEISFMMIGGKYSHAVLKRAKPGDFRVQDDYGGTVENYVANKCEVDFAEMVMDSLSFQPLYARVDVLRDNNNMLALSELELIEPEMWFRNHPAAAKNLAKELHLLCFDKN